MYDYSKESFKLTTNYIFFLDFWKIIEIPTDFLIMVTANHGFQNLGRERSNNVVRILIATILVATIEISQVKAFSSLGLASRFLSHHYTPQYMIDLPPVDRYNTYGEDTSEVENEVGMMEEIPMKKSKLYVSNVLCNKI